MERVFADLEERARGWFQSEGIADRDRQIRRTIDMRYKGQNYELSVPVPGGRRGEALLIELRQGFEQTHQQMYGYTAPEEPIQAITFRIEAIGVVPQAEITRQPPAARPVEEALSGRRDVWLVEAGGFVSCPVYDRERLGPGHHIAGPAVVEQMDATTLMLPGQSAVVDPFLNIIVEG